VHKILTLAAALLAVLMLALGATSAPAADKASLADDVAKRLGVTPAELHAAFKAALTARVDAALAAGKVTREQATNLKARIAMAQGLRLGALGKQSLAKRLTAKAKRRGTAAEYLGLSRQELRAKLQAGDSLAEIAATQGKTTAGLVAAMLEPVEERLAKAVEAKRLTRERADRLLERLEKRMERRIDRSR